MQAIGVLFVAILVVIACAVLLFVSVSLAALGTFTVLCFSLRRKKRKNL